MSVYEYFQLFQFAEEAVSNVISVLATQNATSLSEVRSNEQQALITFQHIISAANRDSVRLIADYAAKNRLIA